MASRWVGSAWAPDLPSSPAVMCPHISSPHDPHGSPVGASYPHWADGETEAWRGGRACPRRHGEQLLELGSGVELEVLQSGQEAGRGDTAVLVVISHSSGCHLSWHMTPPKLGKAVLELEDGRQPEQQKTELN